MMKHSGIVMSFGIKDLSYANGALQPQTPCYDGNAK